MDKWVGEENTAKELRWNTYEKDVTAFDVVKNKEASAILYL